ncbi:MAG: hypothetical protein KDA83_21155, partial [Planctomycetales bacterium]|nr:hypothetical protein [Planctomycetales bacterium]
MLASSTLAALCCLLQDAPPTPLPTSGPIRVEVGSDEGAGSGLGEATAGPVDAASSEGSRPAEVVEADEVPAVRPVAGDDSFRESLEARIREDNPGLSEDSVREMAASIVEMRQRLSRRSPLGPVVEDNWGGPSVPTPDTEIEEERYIGPRPDASPYELLQWGPGPDPQNPMGTPIPNPYANQWRTDSGYSPPVQNGNPYATGMPGMQGMPGQLMPGMMPAHPMPNLDSPDEFYVHSLRQAARQLDEAAANLEDRGAY